jgi:hypothetical protein
VSEIDQRLIALAVREIRSVESETGESLSAEDAVQVVLGLFAWRDEFQSVYQDDVGHPMHDPTTPGIYDNAADLAADMAKAREPWRHMEHRFVAETGWERIEAHISWEAR